MALTLSSVMGLRPCLPTMPPVAHSKIFYSHRHRRSAVWAGIEKPWPPDDLRFLLYPSDLSPLDREWAENHQQGIRWLEKPKNRRDRRTLNPGSPEQPVASVQPGSLG